MEVGVVAQDNAGDDKPLFKLSDHAGKSAMPP